MWWCQETTVRARVIRTKAKLLAPVSLCLKTTLGFIFLKLKLNTRWLSLSRDVILHISQTVNRASVNLGSITTESENRARRPNGDRKRYAKVALIELKQQRRTPLTAREP